MEILNNNIELLKVRRDNGTIISAVRTPGGIMVFDTETSASTLHVGITVDEAAEIRKNIIESCRKGK